MATIKDVAKLANVSTATVSRIINGKGEASPETIKKVMKVVEELNYRPNSLAKNLSAKSSNLIALLIPNLDNPFFSEQVKAIETAANQEGYQIYLCNSEDDREKVEYYLNSMSDNFVAGAIINSLQVTEDDLRILEEQGISTITIDRTQTNHVYSSITVDHEYGGYIATNTVLSSTNKKNPKCLFLSGQKGEKSSLDRYNGFKKALGEHSIVTHDIVYANFNIESGYLMTSEYLKHHKVDIIVSSNDAMALGAIRSCQDLNINIPEDIQIIGYDNINLGNYTNPRISTIDQMKRKTATLAIKELIRLKNNLNKPKHYNLKPNVIVRESSL